MSKPRVVTHQFGPFMISNRKWGKIVDPYITMNFKTYPVAEADIEVQVGRDRSRMTATRVLGGGVLLGPVGMILGGMARKDVTQGVMTIRVGDAIQRHEFSGRDIDKAEAFVQALSDAQADR